MYQLISNGKSVHLIWVREHCGLVGNDKANAWAKEALRQRVDHVLSHSHSDWKNHYTQNLSQKWKRNYLVQRRVNFTLLFYPGFAVKPWFRNYSYLAGDFTPPSAECDLWLNLHILELVYKWACDFESIAVTIWSWRSTGIVAVGISYWKAAFQTNVIYRQIYLPYLDTEILHGVVWLTTFQYYTVRQ